MKLRLCDEADLAALVALAELFHAEIGDAFFLPFSADKTAWFLKQAIERRLVIAVEEDGELVGGVALYESAPLYSVETGLYDMGFYVKEEYRRSRAAVLLRDAAKAIAADMGKPLLLGVSSGADLDRKDKFFTRAGFRRVGSFYLWR
jgi:GNAT superfamily N-acetyltransferase